MLELTKDEKNIINELVESSKYAKLHGRDKASMQTLLENTYLDSLKQPDFNVRSKIITESTTSGDVAMFTPILLPMVRRVFPQLIANQLLGVQPMSMPTGYIYALINTYTGDNADKKIEPTANAVIVKCSEAPTDIAVGETVFTDGKVIHKEGLLLLIRKGESSVIEVGATIKGSVTVTEMYSNEASFLNILQNYTGPHTTASGEKLGNDMKEVGISVSKKSIEAKTRKLKGQWTVEMYQDLKAQHNLEADNEMVNLISYEIQQEIDREIVNFVNSNATQLPDSKFVGTSVKDYAHGRWDVERYRAEAIRINKESTIIGVETKRGHGNILLVSPKVCTMLEEISPFKLSPIDSTVEQPIGGGVAGIFDNKYKVIVDQYSKNDYCTVIYKGQGVNDAMGFFAPYVPLSFTKIMDQTSGQPGVICSTRYGLTTVPGVVDPNSNDRAKTYARSFAINFENTILA